MIQLGVTDGSSQISLQVATRSGDGYSATGRAVKGAETVSAITGDVQPVSSSDLRDMPEGVRDVVEFAIWTQYDLKTDHIVIYNGDRCRVYKTKEYRFDGYTKGFIGRQKTQ